MPNSNTFFGVTADGRTVHLHTLSNASGMQLSFLTLGGIIVSLRVPDRTGALGDIVLGRDTLAEYEDAATPYFGAIIGRYANRIANARFELDGYVYQLAPNVPPNALHGGARGLDKVVWDADASSEGDNAITLRYTSSDGEEGYPGTARFAVTYRLEDTGTLTVDYDVETDRATPVNLTQHSYFNLAGHDGGDVLGHQLTLFASSYTPIDASLLPTGEIAPVDGSPFDFRIAQAIGKRIREPHPQLEFGGGYDHNFVLDGVPVTAGSSLSRTARVVEPRSGRTLDVATTEPGVQLYTSNAFDGTLRGKRGAVYPKHAAFCLETQHFPDSPNRPSFPTTIVRPGIGYKSRTTFLFGVDA